MGFRGSYGPWAVVAGGSEGLGWSFARQLAERGLDLVLVAHEQEALDRAADRLRMETGVQVRTVLQDLTVPGSAETVADAVADLEVGLLVWVAAVPAIGPLVEQTPDRLRAMVECNVTGPLLLTRALTPAMIERGRGGVVLLSSLSALHGSANIAAYAATKSFLKVLGEGLWAELEEAGVDVVSTMPGATDTPAYRSSQPAATRRLSDPDDVARETLAALGRQPLVVPGVGNRAAAALLGRLLPTRLAIRLVSNETSKMYGR